MLLFSALQTLLAGKAGAVAGAAVLVGGGAAGAAVSTDIFTPAAFVAEDEEVDETFSLDDGTEADGEPALLSDDGPDDGSDDGLDEGAGVDVEADAPELDDAGDEQRSAVADAVHGFKDSTELTGRDFGQGVADAARTANGSKDRAADAATHSRGSADDSGTADAEPSNAEEPPDAERSAEEPEATPKPSKPADRPVTPETDRPVGPPEGRGPTR